MKSVVYIILILSSSVRAQNFDISFELKSGDVELHKLRFYVSNIIINDSVHPEQQPAYLMDLLAEGSNKISIPTGNLNVSNVYFNIGTDSLLNTAGILDGDLDPIKGMYWAWNTGYINFKIEGVNNSKHRFEYHIGGYRSPFTTVRSFEEEVTSDNLNLVLDLNKFLLEAESVSSELMIPGKEAAQLSDLFKNCLHVKE